MKHEVKIAKITTVIIFVALIRTVSEPLRLNYYSESPINFIQIKPYLIAAIIISVGLLGISILNYYNKHKLIIVSGILIISLMVFVKYYFGIK